MTTVEWLAKEIRTFEEDYGAIIHYKGELEKLLNQAKEMHKQEIIDAYDHNSFANMIGESEEYYNETFKNQQQ